MQLETNLLAKFIPDTPPITDEEVANLEALNKAVEDCTERLQETFRRLIIEMLELKRGNL